ncbi:DUF488 domain-containing protein [Sinorhizobium meliloti]|uniref:DUF488 domain-containing protein n=1 Tax=Rhizobium meliloti TaxID=382 RepID=UPI000FDC6991|nr:DUF488 domain-containing protein [Sinorhizobium meliloti]RVM58886.1 DUF488 domain-containing protein [Sinorhizobium meliloti]
MPSLMTIGYEGSTIDDFVRTLEIARVKVLVDVRAVTVSRKKGFSKNGLAARLDKHGIRYVHAKHLGDPKPGREAARAGDYASFRRIFGEHLATEEAQRAVRDVASIAAGSMTCLMCYERDPSTCHRQIVATQLRDYDFTCFDLFVDKKDRYERHPEKLPSHNPGKSTPAAEQRTF